MLVLVVDVLITVLAAADFGLVLGLVKVELVLDVNIAAQILWQLKALVNLNLEVDPLVNQVTWLIWNDL